MLWILCVDGLGYDLWKEFELDLPYLGELDIPKECYRNDYPFTPDVWGSMFLGQLYKHPKSKFTQHHPLRLRTRTFLKKLGISWSRRGGQISKKGELNHVPSYIVFEQMKEKTIFDNYNSFTWGIPSVCDGFLFKSYQGNIQDHEAFKSMAYSSYCKTFDLVGIYTHLIDEVAHRVISKGDSNYKRLKYLYNEIHFLYTHLDKNKHDVIILSDHSCLGNHGHKAFIGSNNEFHAQNILDVYSEIQNRMETKS